MLPSGDPFELQRQTQAQNEGVEEVLQENDIQRKAGADILISDKVDITITTKGKKKTKIDIL